MNFNKKSTSKFAIVYFPKNLPEEIHRFRERYDPKYSYIQPHITLVFPFIEDSLWELIQEMKILTKKQIPFSVTLEWFSLNPVDNLLYYLVRWGGSHIVSLHDRLYSGRLGPFLRKDLKFVPHMTIGNFANNVGSLDKKTYSSAEENINTLPILNLRFDNIHLIEIEGINKERRIIESIYL